jgi:MFS family permease
LDHQLFEVPSNMILRHFHPVRYIAGLTIIWGILATCCGLVQGFGSLVAVRLLLGLFESGLFPGLVMYVSLFYTRRHIALRTACLLGTAAIAGAIGGFLAYAIGHMDGVRGMRAWRYIMIIEGAATVVLGIAVPFIMPDTPETASCLTEQDRADLLALRRAEIGNTAAAQHFHKSDLKKGARDWKVYAMPVGHYCTNIMFYSFSVFLPTIINTLGTWSVPQVQALTIPVYGAGAIVYLTCALVSDRIQQRGLFAASFMLIAILGYCLLIANLSSGAKFAGCFLVSIGCYTATGIPLAWVVSNQPRYAKRALASGLQLTIGNSAGIAAPFLYSSQYAPLYRVGYGETLGSARWERACITACISTTRGSMLKDWPGERTGNSRARRRRRLKKWGTRIPDSSTPSECAGGRQTSTPQSAWFLL